MAAPATSRSTRSTTTWCSCPPADPADKFPPVRVLVVTNMWPTERRPALGPFVRDQVGALRALDGVDEELPGVDPPGGAGPFLPEPLGRARCRRAGRSCGAPRR